jgi:hypothetical protein
VAEQGAAEGREREGLTLPPPIFAVVCGFLFFFSDSSFVAHSTCKMLVVVVVVLFCLCLCLSLVVV